MWKLLAVLAVLAELILIVNCSRDTQTIVKVKTKADASSAAAVDGENGTAAAAGAASSAVSTTIIKTSHRHKKCAIHEKYVKCPELLCEPQTCAHVGKVHCPFEEAQNDTEKHCTGPPACICKKDYVRNDEGVCFPAKNCFKNSSELTSSEETAGSGEQENNTEATTETDDADSCSGDFNAKPGCDENCTKRCPGPKPAECKCGGCECKDGFVYNPETRKCVRPEQCNNASSTEPTDSEEPTTPGGDDEDTTEKGDAESCSGDFNAKPGCDENCSKRCPGPKPAECKCGGCECKDGFVYNPETRKCVRPEQCSPKECKGRNEWYFVCAPSCPQRTCVEYLNGVKCPIPVGKVTCKPECRCHIGYYKDDEGNCLSTWECRRRLRPIPTAMPSLPTITTLSNQGMRTTSSTSTTMMSTTPPPNCEDVAYELFVTGNLVYTTKVLTNLIERNPGNSVIVGGASILYLFSQLALFAQSNVKVELLNVLNLRDTEEIRCFFPKISAALNAPYSDIQFSLFCKIYADTDSALTTDFIQETKKLFGIGPENLDFSLPEAAQKINTDVATFTNGIFDKFLKPNILSPLDGMILIDAEDFQGKWEKQFNPANTVKREFYRQRRIDRIHFMNIKDWFLYGDCSQLDAKVLKMHYTGARFALAIILPNKQDGIGDLLRRMKNPENIKKAFDSLKYGNVEVCLPKFNITVANKLKIPSEMANIKQSFNSETDGFLDITTSDSLYVSEILQRINYQINEYGIGDKLQPEFTSHVPLSKVVTSHVFRADHPFIYMLCFDKIVVQAGLYA